jgi:hypothetical protein
MFMVSYSKNNVHYPSSAGFIARLLLVIFSVEFSVMMLFDGLLNQLNPISASLADGVLVVLLSAPFVWFWAVRPLATGKTTPGAVCTSSLALFVKVLAVISAVEFAVNMLLLISQPQAYSFNFCLTDASLTTVLSTPLLWGVMSLEQRNHSDSLHDLLGTPLKLYLILLGAVFFVELLEAPIISLVALPWNGVFRKLADAFLTTLIVAPVFWGLVIRPLRKDVWSERSRSDAILAQVIEAVVTIDEQGVVINSNPAAERIFGYPATEITGRPVALLLGDEGLTSYELVRSVTAAGEDGPADLTQEVTGRRRDGSTLSLEISLNRVISEGKQRLLIFMRDISERKQAERTLQKSLSLLAATLESTADGILVIDSSRAIQTFNQKFLDMFRLPRSVVENSDKHGLIAQVKVQLEDPEAFVVRLEELYRQPETSSLDILRFKDGRVFERYSQPQMSDGATVGRVWSFRDITTRTKAEEALKESEERFSIAVDGSNDGVWDWDIQKGTIYNSPRLKQMLGYGDDDFTNEVVFMESLLHPEDHAAIRAAILAHLRERTPYDVECRLRTKRGTYRWYWTHGQAVWDEKGNAVRMAGCLSDITRRKDTEDALRESELRFRQIFEQSEDAIIFFNPGTCSLIDLNQTAEKLFGYTKVELKSLGMECLCRPEDFPRFSSAICNVKHGTLSQLDRMVNRRKNGSEITVSVRGKIMTLQGVDIVFCSIRDITDRIHLEEEARDIQSKLIHTNKMTSLGLLVSGVAHEINNPNNYVMANSRLLANVWQDALKVLREYYRENGDFMVGGIPFSIANENSTQLFTGIIDGSSRINDIVSNLKDFARQDRSMAGGDVDINRIITSAVTILHHQLIKHTDRFHLDLQENLPSVKGSSQQLEQVVINLLMNACQALPDKRSGIWVTTGYDESSGQVNVTVRDEGLGMPATIHDRVLEPFFTTKLDSGGTGLGLSISQSIVKEHNGSLEFTSDPGTGTTFSVKIPAGRPAVEEHSP